MRTREDIESYLDRAEVQYEVVGDDSMWLVRDPSLGENIAVKAAGPLLRRGPAEGTSFPLEML